jgi:hypothetical protein
MTARNIWLAWIVVAVVAVVLALLAPADTARAWQTPSIIATVVVMIGVTVVALFYKRPLLGMFYSSPALYWLLALIVLCVAAGWYVTTYQPTYGRYLAAAEYVYIFAFLWLIGLLFGIPSAEARQMGGKLSKSPFTGLLVTLTTLLLLFWGTEAWFRLFYITTDGYGFTAMNYWWYQNFLIGQDNSLAFRDYEPQANATTRIAVVGDSFAVGHGINSIDDTFAQMLERDLGVGFDVNLVARSGWDTPEQFAALQNYPYRPNVVVWSYYLNDIDYLMQDQAINPNANFSFPKDPLLNWIVLNFFNINYVYYNMLQFTSPIRTGNHANALTNAYTTPALWDQQAALLREVSAWAKANDIRLVVLLWPHVSGVEESQAALDPLRALFAEQGVEVVDMTDFLRGQDVNRMMVNRFDAHPSIAANRLAADALLAVLRAPAP